LQEKEMKRKFWIQMIIALVCVAGVIVAQTQEKELPAKSDTVTEQQITKQETGQGKQENGAGEDQETSTGSLLDLFELGGPFMWPLLIFSIIVLAVILERTVVFAGKRFNVKKLGMDLLAQLNREGADRAAETCLTYPKNIASEIFHKSIPALKRGAREFEKSVEAMTSVKVSSLEKNLNILSSMGNIAPLTGFLGTVSGMITAFKTIALSDHVTARLVAGGIYEALITTAFGLIIAIIAVGGNNFFVHKVDSSVTQIEETATRMVEATTREQ
jgi:biopolymer transport protein ExbB